MTPTPTKSKVVKTKTGVTLSAVKGSKPAKIAPIAKSNITSKVTSIKSRAVVAAKVSVTEALSTSRLMKKGDVVKIKSEKSTTLTLVAKKVAKTVTKMPATKISRSEPAGLQSKVITGKFSVDSEAETPAARNVVEMVRSEVSSAASAVNFKTGDKIVYPGHGVGEIEGIRSTVLGGQEHHIYNIKILDSGMKVMVPVSQAAAVGLRKIVDKKAIDEVFSILRDRDFKIDTQTWNRRFREYSQKIKTGSVFEIAIVLRDLLVLSADKELSFGEKKMLDTAESLLVSEIAIAKARPHDKVVGELRALFA
ncbi:MAG: CarD family transcriptional regulator [Pseudomonadota bacterium]|jgi:CarD family transcriptional regulator